MAGFGDFMKLMVLADKRSKQRQDEEMTRQLDLYRAEATKRALEEDAIMSPFRMEAEKQKYDDAKIDRQNALDDRRRILDAAEEEKRRQDARTFLLPQVKSDLVTSPDRMRQRVVPSQRMFDVVGAVTKAAGGLGTGALMPGQSQESRSIRDKQFEVMPAGPVLDAALSAVRKAYETAPEASAPSILTSEGFDARDESRAIDRAKKVRLAEREVDLAYNKELAKARGGVGYPSGKSGGGRTSVPPFAGGQVPGFTEEDMAYYQLASELRKMKVPEDVIVARLGPPPGRVQATPKFQPFTKDEDLLKDTTGATYKEFKGYLNDIATEDANAGAPERSYAEKRTEAFNMLNAARKKKEDDAAEERARSAESAKIAMKHKDVIPDINSAFPVIASGAVDIASVTPQLASGGASLASGSTNTPWTPKLTAIPPVSAGSSMGDLVLAFRQANGRDPIDYADIEAFIKSMTPKPTAQVLMPLSRDNTKIKPFSIP